MIEDMPHLSEDRANMFDVSAILSEFGEAIRWIAEMTSRSAGGTRFNRYIQVLSEWQMEDVGEIRRSGEGLQPLEHHVGASPGPPIS